MPGFIRRFIALAAALSTLVPAHASDLTALQAFYNATGGSGWTNRAGWLTNDNPCGWFGVGCDAGGNVTALLLPSNNLTGQLPSDFAASLVHLKSVNLSFNALTGS